LDNHDETSERAGSDDDCGNNRSLGKIGTIFAVGGATAAAVGSLFTSLLLRLSGATDMSPTTIVGVAAVISAVVYVLIYLGNHQMDKANHKLWDE